MIIKKLTMHNFGVYADTNVLEFEGKKPVVLIGGMNGRGKTTILEAVLLSLYGAKSFAYTESRYATYGQYLKSYVNKTDGTMKTYVEIEFSMDEFGKELYCIKREWDGKGLRVNEKITVKKDGEENSFLTENWPMFIENILPSALSNFFFFDGEKIAELAVEETSKQMKESIKAMLGITVLDVLQGDVGRVIKKISRNTDESLNLKKLDELRSVKEEAGKKQEEANIKIENLRIELEELQNELEKLNIEYSVKGGGILEQKNILMKQRAEALAIVDSCQEQLLEIIAGELPLALVKNLLGDVEVEAKQEHERKITDIAVNKIKKMYTSFDGQSKAVAEFIHFMEKEVETAKKDEIYGLSDVSLMLLERLNTTSLKNSRNKAITLCKKRDLQQSKIDEIDNSLALDIDENLLKELFDEIKKKEKSILEKQVEIDTAEKERSALNGALMIAESEFSKFAEKTLIALENADTDERTVKYAHMAIEIIKLYRIKLQERKTGILAQTITECYKRLANKKNLADHVEVDSETLDLHYMDNEGIEIAKKRLSAGEKQLMVVSLLWALAICSKKKLPVIIDTPLSRLDSSHRQSLIMKYFPNASDQTIILSTDSEIDKKYYEMMKNSVGDEFTLEYSDLTKNTTIKSGYFGWGGEN